MKLTEGSWSVKTIILQSSHLFLLRCLVHSLGWSWTFSEIHFSDTDGYCNEHLDEPGLTVGPDTQVLACKSAASLLQLGHRGQENGTFINYELQCLPMKNLIPTGCPPKKVLSRNIAVFLLRGV